MKARSRRFYKLFRSEYFRMEILSIAVVCIYLLLTGLLTGKYLWSRSPYNSYALQAAAWLDGRLDLGQDYPWLELAIYEGKYYVSFPPFPSYLLFPLAIFWGSNTPDFLVVFISDLLTVIFCYRIAKHFKLSPLNCMISTLFATISTNMVFTMIDGSVWFLAQDLCITLTLMSIYYALKNKIVASLALWACAVGCRPMQAVCVPILLYIICRNEKLHSKEGSFITKLVEFLKEHWKQMILAVLIAVSYMILNFARFGNPLEFGHNYLPEHQNSLHGQFSFIYVPENLRSMFRMIEFDENGKFVINHFGGLSVFIVSPIVLVPLIFVGIQCAVCIKKRKKLKKKLRRKLKECLGVYLICAIYLWIVLMHSTLGAWHFGNRYANDIIPWIFLMLIVCTCKEQKYIKYEMPLAVWGMCLNIVGTVIVYNGL